MKFEKLKWVPNLLSLTRLLLIPVLWFPALEDMPFHVGLGLTAAGLTDVLDGFIARRMGWVTAFGSRLDSVADNLLLPCVIIWAYMLRPEIFHDHMVLIIVWIVLDVSSITLGWVKFRRFANLHLYSSKASGLVSYIFIVLALMFGYNETLFYLTIVLLIISSVETILIQLMCRSVDEHMKSIVHSYYGGRLK